MNLGYPRDLSLFRTQFDDAALPAVGTGLVGNELALVIARMDFLRSHEKLALAAEAKDLDGLSRLKGADIRNLVLRSLDLSAWDPARLREEGLRDAEYLAAAKIRFVPITDRAYPPQLREVYRPPFGLYVRGRLPDPEKPGVGIVGTRVPTQAGLKAAYTLAAELSGLGICVVSGLARGVDSAAHRGALRGRGNTLAVLPAGIERIYPASNKALAGLIIDSGGALVTEYPPRTGITRWRFPERNRIIAGLSRSCVIVEAPERSGALITSEHALTEGRDVFVHGACLAGTRDSGGKALAAQGAVVVQGAADILAEWSSGGRIGIAGESR
jgi:DNA processing protein